ncbi:MAG: 16S rRNA (cytosine(1402)-N(4))-methyltransferase RsmH [Endomicrobiales bacterium]
METSGYHQPVMVREVEQYLVHREDGLYADCTLGGGGHSGYLLGRHPRMRVIGLDWDEEAMTAAQERLRDFQGRVRFARENFRDLNEVLEKEKIETVDGVLLDLGVSSRQFDETARGFSFLSPALDMRMDRRLDTRAGDLVNTLDEESLADLFYRFGEERLSRPISRRIVEERKKGRITSGPALAALVERVKRKRGKIHPATQVFQALRIAVNLELDNLSVFLERLPALLAPRGRAVIISYHSLEDRIVKQDFRKNAGEGVYRLLTKKVVFASPEEMKNNPRSRSARLRCAERI